MQLTTPAPASRKKSNAGYSLIQIAIGMIVVGIFMASAGHAYILYKKNKDIIETKQNVQSIAMAMRSFHQSFGFYPCPAPMNVARNDPAYGQPTNCLDTTSIPIGNCSSPADPDKGICIEQATDGSVYNLTSGLGVPTANRAAALTNARVRLGAVPFRLLQIDEKRTYDAYGSRLLYALTESLGASSTYSEQSGAINIVNALGDNLTEPPGSAPFIILSHGPNQLGGYASSGAMISECGGAVLDAENCRVFDPAAITLPPITPAMPPLAVFVSDYLSNGATAAQFDDVVEYFADTPSAQWRRTDTNIENIQTMIDDSVGIDVPNPTNALEVPLITTNFDHDNNPVTPARAHIGALRAETSVQAEKYCEVDGTNCFDPLRLAGTGATDPIKCANPSKIMVGVQGGTSEGEAICEDAVFYCTNGATPILQGVTAAGTPICVAKPLNPCNGLTVQLCSGAPLTPNLKESDVAQTNPVAMPNSGHLAIYTVTDPASYGLNPRSGQFQCWNGVWKYNNVVNGLCSCNVPASTAAFNLFSACPPNSPSGNAAFSLQTWNAASCSWSGGPVNYGGCACPNPTAVPVPADNGAISVCGAGYNTGNITKTYTFNYANNVCAWQAGNANTCGCALSAAVDTDGTVDGFRTTSTSTQCYNVTPGFTGTAYSVQQFNTAAGVCGWFHHHWDLSGCTCNQDVFDHNEDVCNPICEDRLQYKQWWAIYAPAPVVCTKGTPYPKFPALTHTDYCAPKTLKWTATSAAPLNAGDPAASPGSDPKLTTACSCADKIAGPRNCYSQPTPGDYYFYNCTCQ